ncbi:hypothetical protein GCM10010302_51260 [Streptomyces polychromogenes]|uniref:TetR family transcriptional regulator n=1 Tax=Streptomyces polychromogenes TaxID=67342 RepID=A0ABP3F619_9ACTN
MRRGSGMPTFHADRSNGHEAATDIALSRVRAVGDPSSELLDRALAGWQRFLATFEAAPDE